MHDEQSKATSAVATAMAFLAGIAIGISNVRGHAEVVAQPRMVAESHAPVGMPKLPPEAAAAFALAQALDAYGEGEPRECTSGRNERCIFN
jgi:hypothetical protein